MKFGRFELCLKIQNCFSSVFLLVTVLAGQKRYHFFFLPNPKRSLKRNRVEWVSTQTLRRLCQCYFRQPIPFYFLIFIFQLDHGSLFWSTLFVLCYRSKGKRSARCSSCSRQLTYVIYLFRSGMKYGIPNNRLYVHIFGLRSQRIGALQTS